MKQREIFDLAKRIVATSAKYHPAMFEPSLKYSVFYNGTKFNASTTELLGAKLAKYLDETINARN